MKTIEMVNTQPIITGKSYLFRESTMTYPSPFHPKIYSMKTTPAINEANQPETAVITGFNEFFKACFHMIRLKDKPFALAVLI